MSVKSAQRCQNTSRLHKFPFCFLFRFIRFFVLWISLHIRSLYWRVSWIFPSPKSNNLNCFRHCCCSLSLCFYVKSGCYWRKPNWFHRLKMLLWSPASVEADVQVFWFFVSGWTRMLSSAKASKNCWTTRTSWLSWTLIRSNFTVISCSTGLDIRFICRSLSLLVSITNNWISAFPDEWQSCSCSTLKSVEFIWMTNWWDV